MDSNKNNKVQLLDGCSIVVNCQDTYSSILSADQEIALLMTYGAHVWINISHIINNDVIKVALRFCRTAHEVDGKLNMWIDINHPQLCNLINHREVKHHLSLIVNDQFMQALINERGYGDIEEGKIWYSICNVANICFKQTELQPYCINEIKVLDLMQMLKAGDNGEYIDYKHFKTMCNTAIEDYKEHKRACISHLRETVADNKDELLSKLIQKVIVASEQSSKLHWLFENFDNLLRALDADNDIEIKQSLINVVNDTNSSHFCVSKYILNKNIRNEEQKQQCIRAWQYDCDYFSLKKDISEKNHQHYMADEEHILKRPQVLEADVVRFQNKKEKWIAFVGLIDGRPYEVFTGIQDDEEGIFCPKSVNNGKIIKCSDENGQKRYDFQFINKRGFKTTIEGLSEKFNPEFWNYAKLISGVLRYGMPIEQVVKLVSSLELDNLTINNWKSGVIKALKKYLPNSDSEV